MPEKENYNKKIYKSFKLAYKIKKKDNKVLKDKITQFSHFLLLRERRMRLKNDVQKY